MRISSALALVAAFWFGSAVAAANAQPVSSCLAVADTSTPVQTAALQPVALAQNEVSITFVGHATFLIESAGGVTVATDYAGYLPDGLIPTVVTMNRAHRTHYTDNPSPLIQHVLRGWGTEGTPARHHLTVGDMTVRNVTTDIRDWSGGRIPDGNSIFIFEVAGLCIGHLGHLHHTLGPDRLGQIGRLDIVMVPVDGSFTMNQASMVEVLKELRAQLVIPMHYFGPDTLARFLDQMQADFAVETRADPHVVVSASTLPERPTVLVLPGH
ncbi:MBL fold metallo-hydrolase [Rhodoligotrophos defluvii]|uniref:MBL fold metallo-hydrolase n=1 Tax=Rhodoligotrophos defluvii TaxID=2561934 RepID=UPI0010C9BBD3|nr:MBL fold metallo-hydrolase [Rhodoligotrophos defluvii]